MFSKPTFTSPGTFVSINTLNFFRTAAVIAALFTASLLSAQTQSGQTSQQPANNQQNQNQNQNTTGESGGPKGDIGPIAVPKKGDNDATTKKDVPPKPKPVEGMPDFSINVSVPVVTLDVGVVSKDGMFLPGLKQDMFRVLEDGVPQTISSFQQTQGPITAVI